MMKIDKKQTNIIGLLGKKVTLFDRFLVLFPLTTHNIRAKTIRKDAKTILDVGCGTGLPMRLINKDKNYEVTGVDAYLPYITECKQSGYYNKVIVNDIRKINFPKNSFDVVTCFHVLEHLPREDAIVLLNKFEKIARKRVVLSLPVGNFPQDEYDNNPLQNHVSAWQPQDFHKRGYSVVGQGLKLLYGNSNVVKKFGHFSYLFFMMAMMFQPLMFLRPEWAVYMYCWKDMESN